MGVDHFGVGQGDRGEGAEGNPTVSRTNIEGNIYLGKINLSGKDKFLCSSLLLLEQNILQEQEDPCRATCWWLYPGKCGSLRNN